MYNISNIKSQLDLQPPRDRSFLPVKSAMGKTQKRRREHESDSDSDSSECSYLVESKKDESDDERDKSSKDDDDGNSDEPSDEAEEGLSEYEKFRLGKIDRNN